MHRLATCLLLVLAGAAACSHDAVAVGHIGDPDRGRQLARAYGCHTCHVVPGVSGAAAHVGPPLGQLARRVYAGGRLNTPDHLAEFLRDPRRVNPRTPMPDVGLDERDAADITAFLFTLR